MVFFFLPKVRAALTVLRILHAACLVINDPCYSITGFEFELFDDLLPVILLLTLQ